MFALGLRVSVRARESHGVSDRAAVRVRVWVRFE